MSIDCFLIVTRIAIPIAYNVLHLQIRNVYSLTDVSKFLLYYWYLHNTQCFAH